MPDYSSIDLSVKLGEIAKKCYFSIASSGVDQEMILL